MCTSLLSSRFNCLCVHLNSNRHLKPNTSQSEPSITNLLLFLCFQFQRTAPPLPHPFQLETWEPSLAHAIIKSHGFCLLTATTMAHLHFIFQAPWQAFRRAFRSYGPGGCLFPRLASLISRYACLLLGLRPGKCHRLWSRQGLWSRTDWGFRPGFAIY